MDYAYVLFNVFFKTWQIQVLKLQGSIVVLAEHTPNVFLNVHCALNLRDYIRYNQFYAPIKSLLLRMKYVFKNKDLQMFDLKLTSMSNFHPFEVVDCGSEAQLQVGENLNYLKDEGLGFRW